jgi:hypothetical protein
MLMAEQIAQDLASCEVNMGGGAQGVRLMCLDRSILIINSDGEIHILIPNDEPPLSTYNVDAHINVTKENNNG